MRRFAINYAESSGTRGFIAITWYALLGLVILSISRAHQAVPRLAQLHPALLLFAVAAFAALLHGRMSWQNLSRFWAGTVVLALGVLACVSAPFGISFGSSASFILSNYGKTLLVAALLIASVRDWRDVSRIVWAYVLGVGLLAALSLFVYDISKTQSNDTFDANDVGLIMVTGIPLALVTFQTSRWKGKVASLAVLLLSVATIARSLSRGAFVGLVIVGVALILTLRATTMSRRLAILCVVAMTLVLGAPRGYWNMMHTLVTPTKDYNWDSAGGRKELVERGLGYMMSYPVFGIGIHNFERAEGTISERALNRLPGRGVIWQAPHNSYIEIGAELGIAGFVLYLTLITGCIVSMRRLHHRLPPEWRSGRPGQRFLFSVTNALPIAMIGFAVTSFFVSFAYLDVPYVLIAMVCGTHVCVTRMLPAVASAPSRMPLRRASVPASRRLSPSQVV